MLQEQDKRVTGGPLWKVTQGKRSQWGKTGKERMGGQRKKKKKEGGGSTSRPTSPVHPVACKKNKQGWVLVRLPGQACLGAECGLPGYSRTACWLF